MIIMTMAYVNGITEQNDDVTNVAWRRVTIVNNDNGINASRLRDDAHPLYSPA